MIPRSHVGMNVCIDQTDAWKGEEAGDNRAIFTDRCLDAKYTSSNASMTAADLAVVGGFG